MTDDEAKDIFTAGFHAGVGSDPDRVTDDDITDAFEQFRSIPPECRGGRHVFLHARDTCQCGSEKLPYPIDIE